MWRRLLPLLIILSGSSLLAETMKVGEYTVEVTRAAVQDCSAESRLNRIAQRIGTASRLLSAKPTGRLCKLLFYQNSQLTTVTTVPGQKETADQVQKPYSFVRPSREEYENARSVLETNTEFGEAVKNKLYDVRMAMPGARVTSSGRKITLDLVPSAKGKTQKGITHRIVDVDLNATAPQTVGTAQTLPAAPLCGLPAFPGYIFHTSAGYNLKIMRPDVNGVLQEIWAMTVWEPTLSSATNGSGIDLENVYFKKQKVMNRAHVPIVNVNYGPGGCGTFRDWLDEEGKFKCDGTSVDASHGGIRFCTTKPQTIFGDKDDNGNYSGVAVWSNANKVVLSTEMDAGWYRYVMEWRFFNDGTILPRFGFLAVQNSCVCNPHTHHAYWRFDFDIDGTATSKAWYSIDTQPDVWTKMTTERSVFRSTAALEHWKFTVPSGKGFMVTPGPSDGTADEYGVKDVWLLNYQPNEIDDIGHFSPNEDERIMVDSFVNGEDIRNKRIVMWYGGHFYHDASNEVGGVDPDAILLGPKLTPVGTW